jgi:phosphatidylglycerophosphatase A
MKSRIINTVGSVFYAGYFPFAPATFASFVWLLAYLFIPGGEWLASPIILVIVVPVAVYLSHEMERMHGADSSRIVIDEFAGMQVTFLMLDPSITIGAVGFCCFRFFDILKPFPINRSQRLRGGVGVVVDDLIAGLYARIVLMILIRAFGLS